MATIKLSLKKQKRNDGLHTIVVYTRLKGWGKAVILTTDFQTKLENWDKSAQKIKGRGEVVKKINLQLMQKKSLAAEIIADYSLMKRDITPERFKNEFLNPQLRGDFIAFWEKKIEENYNRGMIGDSAKMAEKRSLSKVKEFSPDGVSFSDISRAWLEKFDEFHARKFNNSRHQGARERERSLKHIKKYLNAARGEIDGFKIRDPFTGFKWPKYQSKPTSLSQKELKTILSFYRNPDKILERMKEIAYERGLFEWNVGQYASESGVNRILKVMRGFLFQCVTGLRFSDLMAIEYAQIDDYLTFTPEKTAESSGKVVKMALTPLMIELIKKGEGRVFSQISNVKFNKYLKEVAQIAEIDKRLTSHVGRHTFASLSIEKGVPLPILADLMGLTNIKTLMVYVHTNQKMRDKYLLNAFGKL